MLDPYSEIYADSELLVMMRFMHGMRNFVEEKPEHTMVTHRIITIVSRKSGLAVGAASSRDGARR